MLKIRRILDIYSDAPPVMVRVNEYPDAVKPSVTGAKILSAKRLAETEAVITHGNWSVRLSYDDMMMALVTLREEWRKAGRDPIL